MQGLSALQVGGHGAFGGGWHLVAATRAAAQRVEGAAAAPTVVTTMPAAPGRTESLGSLPFAGAPAAGVVGVATSAPASEPATQPAKPSFFDQAMTVAPLVVMAALVYLLLFRGKQKEQKKHKAMIMELKKGDRVMTIGGLIARVVSVDGEDVTLKIDESANVKAVYRKSSIQQVLGGEEKSK